MKTKTIKPTDLFSSAYEHTSVAHTHSVLMLMKIIIFQKSDLIQ